ncbi:MAG: hypothetical protein IT305_13110 [Chloroflexi bacterium]|nr:hypothetical protein [Chloroflexota bacterium]
MRDTPRTAIRVMVVNPLDGLLGTVEQFIAEQPDMVLVPYMAGRASGWVELLQAMSADVDVLILGVERVRPPPGICSHLLSEFPGLKIVIVTPGGESGVLYWLGLRRQHLQRVSP